MKNDSMSMKDTVFEFKVNTDHRPWEQIPVTLTASFNCQADIWDFADMASRLCQGEIRWNEVGSPQGHYHFAREISYHPFSTTITKVS